MRILVAYRGLPWPITEGFHLRVLHLFRHLAARHEVHLLGLIHDPAQRAARDPIEEQGIFSSISEVEVARRSWLGRAATNAGLPPVASFRAEYPGFTARLRPAVGDLVRERGIEVGYVFDTWAALWLEPCRVVPTLLDVCDSRSFYYQRFADEPGPGWAAKLRNRQLRRRFETYERFLLERYPVATAVSPEDRDHLRSLAPAARIEVVANGVDLEQFAPLAGVAEQPGGLIFFGNLDFWPNVEAARRLASAILPRVRERHPGATLTLAGSRPAPEVRALAQLPGVEVTGTVPDLRPLIARAAALVAPMRFGGGLKNKVLEAMAMERPVITTTRGAEALAPGVRELLQLADDDAGLAAHAVRLLADEALRRDLGSRGRAAVGRLHSWEAAASRYGELLEELAATGSTG